MTSGKGFKRGFDRQRSDPVGGVPGGDFSHKWELVAVVPSGRFSGTPELVAVVHTTATCRAPSLGCPETRTSGYDGGVWLMLSLIGNGSNHSPELFKQLRGFLLENHDRTLPRNGQQCNAKHPSRQGEWIQEGRRAKRGRPPVPAVTGPPRPQHAGAGRAVAKAGFSRAEHGSDQDRAQRESPWRSVRKTAHARSALACALGALGVSPGSRRKKRALPP